MTSCGARHPQRVCDGKCVRAEVQRHADRRNAIGEQLHEASGHASQVAPIEYLVVADGFRAFDLDALAVREHAVEWLQRQARSLQQVQGPAHNTYVGEAALQCDLSQIPCLAGMATDHRVGSHHNDQSTLAPAASRSFVFRRCHDRISPRLSLEAARLNDHLYRSAVHVRAGPAAAAAGFPASRSDADGGRVVVPHADGRDPSLSRR